MANTTYADIIKSFESLPQSKVVLADGLVEEWFNSSLGVFELEIEDLSFNEELNEFPSKLPKYKIKTLGMLMYIEYLTRELDRLKKINGIVGKDIQMTGSDSAKRVALSDLQLELERAEKMLHKQKQHCFV
jgi:hypothetical protein